MRDGRKRVSYVYLYVVVIVTEDLLGRVNG